MKKSSSVEAFVVDDTDDRKPVDVQESLEWYPFCLRVRCQSSLGNVQAAISDAVSVAVNDGCHQSLYVYGHRPFDTITKNLPVHLFSELHIDRQSAFFFEVQGLDTSETARKVEGCLMAPQLPLVNAAVADPTSHTVCVFAAEALAQATDPDAVLQLSLTVDWPFFAALNGRTKFRKILDASAQYIGIYPNCGGRMQLNRILNILRDRIQKEVQDSKSPVGVKVVRNPPSVQVSFIEGISIVQINSMIASALRAEGFHCEYGPSRVVLWQSPDPHVPVFSTTMDCPELAKRVPPTITSPTEGLLALKKSVAVELENLGLQARLRPIHNVIFSLGGSRCHLWHLAHTIKRGLESLQDCCYAAYVDFGATQLTICTHAPDRIISAIPPILKKLGFEVAKQILEPPKPKTEQMVETELEHVFAFRKRRRLPRTNEPPETYFGEQDLPIAAVKLDGPALTVNVEDYILLHKIRGVVACALDEGSKTCLVQHQPSLSANEIVTLFVSLGFEAALLEGSADHAQKLQTLLTQRHLEECLEDNSATAHGAELLDQIDPKPKQRDRILPEQHYQFEQVASSPSPNQRPAPTSRSRFTASAYEPIVTVALRAKRKNGDIKETCSLPSIRELSPVEPDSEEIFLSVYSQQTKSELHRVASHSDWGSDDGDLTNLRRGRSSSVGDELGLMKDKLKKRARSHSPIQHKHNVESHFLVLEPTSSLHQEEPDATKKNIDSASQPPKDEPLYYFEHEWTFWFDVTDPAKQAPQTAQGFEDQLSDLGSFDNVRSFWRYWNALDVQRLRDNCNLRLFKKNIKPTWEDPMNRTGGAWICRALPRNDRFRLWSNIVLAMIGEMLVDNTNHTVCGVVLSTKASGDTIQLWMDGGYFYNHLSPTPFDADAVKNNDSMDAALQQLLWPDGTDRRQFTYQSHSSRKPMRSKPSSGGDKDRPTPLSPPLGAADGAHAKARGQMTDSDIKAEMREQVKSWLTSINLEEYFPVLIRDGFDDMRSVLALEEKDLDEMDFKKGHKIRFLTAIAHYKETHEFPVTPSSKGNKEGSTTPDAHRRAHGAACNWRQQQDGSGSAAASAGFVTSPERGGMDANQQHLLQQQLLRSPQQTHQMFPGLHTTPVDQFLAAFSHSHMHHYPPPPQTFSDYSFLTEPVMNPPSATQHTTSPRTAAGRAPEQSPTQRSGSGSQPSGTGPTSPLSPATRSSDDEDENDADQPEAGVGEKKYKFGWRDTKSGREWREIDWSTIPEDERKELMERMEQRTAVELSQESQEVMKQAYPLPNAEWQTLGKFIFLRNGSSEEPLPSNQKIGDLVTLALSGIGENPRLLALRFDGVASEAGTPHVVLYKSNCTRQEESNYIQSWKSPPKPLILQGKIKVVWRVRQQKRTNNNRKKHAKRGPVSPTTVPPALGAGGLSHDQALKQISAGLNPASTTEMHFQPLPAPAISRFPMAGSHATHPKAPHSADASHHHHHPPHHNPVTPTIAQLPAALGGGRNAAGQFQPYAPIPPTHAHHHQHALHHHHHPPPKAQGTGFVQPQQTAHHHHHHFHHQQTGGNPPHRHLPHTHHHAVHPHSQAPVAAAAAGRGGGVAPPPPPPFMMPPGAVPVYGGGAPLPPQFVQWMSNFHAHAHTQHTQ